MDKRVKEEENEEEGGKKCRCAETKQRNHFEENANSR